MTQFDDASEQDIDLAYTANKHVPSNSGSDDDDSDPKKCTVYNVKDEQSGGLIPITVTCNGGTNFNSDTVAVCWNKICEYTTYYYNMQLWGLREINFFIAFSSPSGEHCLQVGLQLWRKHHGPKSCCTTDDHWIPMYFQLYSILLW